MKTCNIAILSILFSCSIVLCVVAEPAESSPSLGVRVMPSMVLPLGESADLFRVGFGSSAATLLNFPSLPWLAPAVDLSYTMSPLDSSSGGANLGLARIGAGLSAALSLGNRFSMQAEAAAGYFVGFLAGDISGSGGSFYGSGGLRFCVFINPRFSVDLGTSYLFYNDLYTGLSAGLGTTMRLSGSGGSVVPAVTVPPLMRPGKLPASGFLELADIRIDRVFPVLFKYYDNEPVGRLILKNSSGRALEDIEVRLEMEQYIDSPIISGSVERLGTGQAVEMPLLVLFNERVLEITEGTKVVAKVTVDYTVNRAPARDDATITLEFYDRNALRWDDDRKVAAFVTAKDDEVQHFAKTAASLVREVRREAIATDLQLAMAIASALKAHGVSYVVDPTSSYKELSADRSAVDYVQFPRQTLKFKAGDCDDLSATYCALMESVGVPTAFITVPGHIFAAFQLGLDEMETQATFSSTKDFIIRRDGTVWVPVETTLLNKGFIQAWSAGARQWRENAAAERVGFWPTAEAWSIYQPVAFGAGSFQIDLPAEDEVRAGFATELEHLVEREISGREETLLAALRQQDDWSTRNRLGVLYARYGLEEKARLQFSRIIERREYTPALINLGNLEYLNGRLSEAAGFYERAARADNQNAGALIALSRVHYLLENYGTARRYHEQAAALDRALAERYAYLSETSEEAQRASDSNRLKVLWGD